MAVDPHSASPRSPAQDPRDWTSQQVTKWIEGLGEKYKQFSNDFADHDIDGTTLFTDDSEGLLGDVGITGERDKKKFLEELVKLKEQIAATENQVQEVKQEMEETVEGEHSGAPHEPEKHVQNLEKQLQEREQQIDQMKEALTKTEEAFQKEEVRSRKLSDLLTVVRRDAQRKRVELEREILESAEQHKVILQLYEAEQEALTEEINSMNDEIEDKELLLKEALDQIEKSEEERDSLEYELRTTRDNAKEQETQLKEQIKEATEPEKEKRLMDDLRRYQEEVAKKEEQFQGALKQIQEISTKESERDQLRSALEGTRARIIEKETRLRNLERQLREQQDITEKATDILLKRKRLQEEENIQGDDEIEELTQFLERRRSHSRLSEPGSDDERSQQALSLDLQGGDDDEVEVQPSYHYKEKLQEKDIQIEELRAEVDKLRQDSLKRQDSVSSYTDVCQKCILM